MHRPIVIGSVAYDPKVVTIWEGIKNFFLTEGCPMDFVLFSNYEAQVEALLEKKIDIAWNTNLAYVKSDKRLNGRAKILAMRDTDIAFTSKMLVPEKSDAKSLKDLKGKKVAFGSRDSAQAAVIPEYYLRIEGLKPEQDYQTLRFNSDVGKHGDTGRSEQEVVQALLEGKADAGSVGETTWELLSSQGGKGLKCIWTSPAYSHCCFTALPDMNEEMSNAFVKTLLKMDWNNPAHRPILEAEGLKKWVVGSADGYKDVFKAAEETGYLASADRETVRA